MQFAPVLESVLGGETVGEKRAYELVNEIIDGVLSPVQAAGILTGLVAKGYTRQELVGAARAMRDRSVRVEHDLALVADVVGTGGDRANTINISTLTALVVAAAGVPVAKHGNRAASGCCGSADVLEACGLRLEVPPDVAAASLKATNFAFLFAPCYHPAMRNVVPIRRDLGIPTIFNSLGPLTNPARATHLVVGVAAPHHVTLLGEALKELGVCAGAVLHAENGIDEVAGDAPTRIYSFDKRGSREFTLNPRAHGVDVPFDAIVGGSVSANRRAFQHILAGEPVPAADVVALNAALVLCVCRQVETIGEGLSRARALLRERQALAVFEKAKAFAAA